MNRRSFFRSIAKGVLATVATVYCPRVLATPVPERELTLLELMQQAQERIDAAGGQPTFYMSQQVAEILAARNEILDDMVFVESTEPGHRTTINTPLPEVTFHGIPLRCENPLS